MKVPGRFKAGSKQARTVASVIGPDGAVRRRLTVKPGVRLALRLKPGERLTATTRTATGEVVDKQRGKRGSTLRLKMAGGEPRSMADKSVRMPGSPAKLPLGRPARLPRRKVSIT